MKRLFRIAAIALMAVFLFSVTPAFAAEAWTAYGRGNHASASGDTVSFEGHPTDPFVSMLYRAANDGDYRVLTWHLTEGRADWHTVEGAGFVFNCGISNGNMSGYAVMFCQNDVRYYKLTNVSVAAMQSTQFSSLSGVQLLDTKARPVFSSGSTWYLKLTMSPGTVKFEKYANPSFTGASEIILQDTINDKTGGTGYGPFASFTSHNCESISRYSMEYFNLTITPNTPPAIVAPDVTLNRGASFSAMSGVTADDNEDGDLTSAVKITADDVDTDVPGVYSVTYAVSDLAGASVNHTRKVTVLADALFVVTDDVSGDPVSGVGITISGQGEKASGANGETDLYILTPGTYSWSVTAQHKDYLPLTGTHTANITKSGTTTWPMRIAVELTRKVYDVGVALDVDTIEPLRYNEIATFTLSLTNNGNVPSTPALMFSVPEGLLPVDAAALLLRRADDGFLYTHDAEILPGETISVELPMRVVNIAATAEETLTAALTGLEAEGAAVTDGNADNNTDSASVSVKNPPVVLSKTDELTGNPLGGVAIKVTNSDGESMFTGKSDELGKWTIHGLIPGEYTISEMEGLPGFAKAAGTWTFSRDDLLAVTGDTELTNSPLTLHLTKTDAYSKKMMENIVFTIASKDKPNEQIHAKQQDNGEWYVDANGGTEITTGKDGKIVLRYLPAGDYILTEQIPAGYADAKPLEVTIGQDNSTDKPVEVEAHNLPTKLIFEKLDALSGKPMLALTAANGGAAEIASFRLLNDKGEVVKLDALESGVLRPSSDGKENFAIDANGLREILYLPVSSYTLEEISAATGYGVAAPIKVEVKGENSTENPAKAQMKDDPLALHIQKEKKGGGTLSGAGFMLTVKGSDKALSFSLVDGKYHYAPDGKETVLVVDSQGVALVYYLPAGEYTLTETITPEGYFNAHPVTVKISTENTTAKPAEVTVINEPEVKLGLDNDRWRVTGAIALIAIALGGATVVVIMLRKKQLMEDGAHGS